MDDTPAKENPAKDFNKLDLSQLQGFSFGTQWTQDKASPAERRERADRPHRDRDHAGPGGVPAERRDRRAFRKPAQEGDRSAPTAPAGAPERRPYSEDRPPRREYRPRDGEQGGGRREHGGGRFHERREMPEQRGPYDSPYFQVAFYPEDTSFNALAKTIRSSCRTIELFEIARTVVGKTDRFVVVLTRKQPGAPAGAPGVAPASATAKADKQPIYFSVPDNMPFESEEAAVAHVLTHHLGTFFETAEVEVEPPKGNFQVINRCGVTAELLGPPNYHRYSQIVQQHYASKISRMPFETFRARIETVRDPEVVAQWLEKMKKTTRFTWKNPSFAKPAAKPAETPAAAPAATDVAATAPATDEVAAPAADAAATETPAAPEAKEAPAQPAVPTFDNFEDARAYLLSQAKDKIVRAVESARFHGKLVETMPQGEIRRAIEGALERQRRFPLDTANALRGRLRREHFTIFKKGSKGVSYVCAVKRKFRVPGQTFSETISALIAFIEAHPMIRASELPAKFLSIDLPTAPKASETPAGENAAPAEAPLSIDQRAKITRMQGDLRWLVTEGYVTEFIDGRLFAPPPMVEARKKEVESEEHDPENFPEAPAEPKAETPAAATPSESSEPAPTEPAPAAAPEAPPAS